MTWQNVSYNLLLWLFTWLLLTVRWHTKINVDFSCVRADLGLVHSDVWELAGGHLLQTGLGWGTHLCSTSPILPLGVVGQPRHILLLATIGAQEHEPNVTDNFQASAYITTSWQTVHQSKSYDQIQIQGAEQCTHRLVGKTCTVTWWRRVLAKWIVGVIKAVYRNHPIFPSEDSNFPVHAPFLNTGISIWS